MRTILTSVFLVLTAVSVQAGDCYEFLGGTDQCNQVVPTACVGACLPNHPATGQPYCPKAYLAADHQSPWDRVKKVPVGYGTDGGWTIYCAKGGVCTCQPTMDGEECDDPTSYQGIEKHDLPNVDINSICPEIF